MNKKRKEKDYPRTALIAGGGSALAGATAKQLLAVDKHGGYARNLQTKLTNLKFSPTLAYHLAGITKRIPVAALGTTTSLLTYDALNANSKKDNLNTKLRNAALAGLTSSVATFPLTYNTAAFPNEITKLKLPKGSLAFLNAKNRIAQSLLGATAGLVTYDLLEGSSKDKTKNPLRDVGAGIGAAAVATLATAPPTATFDALVPEVEAKAVETGKKLGRIFPVLNKPTTYGSTFGRQIGRMYHGTVRRLPASLLGLGASYIVYNALKNKLQNKNK